MDTYVTSKALAVIPAGADCPPKSSNVRSVEQLAKSLWRRRIFIGLCSILLGALLRRTKQLPKRFTAGGLVTVDTQRFTVPELQGLVGVDNLVDPSPQVRSETLLLRSPALLRKLVDELNLAEDPEFNPLLRPAGIVDQAKAFARSLAGGVPAERRNVAAWGIPLPEKPDPVPLSAQAVREVVIGSRTTSLFSMTGGASSSR